MNIAMNAIILFLVLLYSSIPPVTYVPCCFRYWKLIGVLPGGLGWQSVLKQIPSPPFLQMAHQLHLYRPISPQIGLY